nr:hypothetical protein [Stomatobaculum longum]
MKLVIAEKPSVAQALAKVLGANRPCEGYLRRGSIRRKDCKSQRSGKKYNASLLLLAKADGKAEFRLKFDDTHDAG